MITFGSSAKADDPLYYLPTIGLDVASWQLPACEFESQCRALLPLLRYPISSLPTVRLRQLSTAATRSGRFICHRQCSRRSPVVGMTVSVAVAVEESLKGSILSGISKSDSKLYCIVTHYFSIVGRFTEVTVCQYGR